MESVSTIVRSQWFRQPSSSISRQTGDTCYAHVIARLMRRLIYTFYDIDTDTTRNDFYIETNVNIEYIMRNYSLGNYNECFAAFVYLYFFNLAIKLNDKLLDEERRMKEEYSDSGDSDQEDNSGGDLFEILPIIIQFNELKKEDVISILGAGAYEGHPLMEALLRFISQINTDTTDEILKIESFRHCFFQYMRNYTEMRAKTLEKLISIMSKDTDDVELATKRIKQESSKQSLKERIIQLCDYGLSHGYYSTYGCAEEEAAIGHVVLIVHKEDECYKIKNSSDFIHNMHITDGCLSHKLFKTLGDNCGIMAVLPTVLHHPDSRVRDRMRDIACLEQTEPRPRSKSLAKRSPRSPRGSPGKSPGRPRSRSPGRSPGRSRSRSHSGEKAGGKTRKKRRL